MRFSKVAVKKYRIYRLFLAAGAGLFAFTISMGGRYSQELDTVHSAQHKAALSAVKQIDHLLSSANDISTTHNELINSTCPQAQPRLLNMSVQLQTVRAILLVKEGLIFCSSLFGHRDYSLGTMFPPFAKPGHNLMLKAALLVKRGSPTLIYWVPTRTDPSSGMIHVSILLCCLTSSLSHKSPMLITWRSTLTETP
ncbi:CSS-motif domain-containing protein [Hafnia paralvei]|uniref:CSS-motif domain-containing protein n=1 Tax=Hafnia paralvei TaxID=546367 RepID=UPI0038CF4CBD